MRSTHSIYKHLCALFVASAIITSFVAIKNKSHQFSGETADGLSAPLFFDNVTNQKLSKSAPKPLIESNYRSFGKRKTAGTIYILGLFELSSKWGERPEGLSELAAAELAIKHVNQLRAIPNYELNLIVNNTECDPGVGIDRFFHAIYSERTIAVLLGTSCSNVTQSLAHVVPYWNILQISFGSTSPSLSDRKKFPLFFRTIAPDSSHNMAKIEFVKHFDWRVVATFCQSEDEYLLPINKLIAGFEEANISCHATLTFSLENYKEQLKTLKQLDIRIIVGAFSTQMAALIFCEMYAMGMYGPDYVWILQDRETAWWNRSSSPCLLEELEKAVNGLILVSDYNGALANGTSVSGLNTKLFEAQLNIRKSEISKYAPHTYDAIWAIALSLKNFPNSFPSDFNYNRKDIVQQLIDRMNSLNFVGISGPLMFQGADRIGSSILRQLQNGKMKDIALFDPITKQLSFQCRTCRPVIWHNAQKPIAQRILKKTLVEIPLLLLYFIVFVAALGIVFSLFFLYFNLHFRRMKTVKLSSPKLNNVAVIGCILVYLFVILLGFDTAKMNKYVDELCTVRVYLLSSGFSLAFGSMFAKTYRVHRIFTSCGGPSKVKDMLLKDKQLIVLILIPLLIDAIILTLWSMIDPLKRQLHNLSLEISSENRGVVYQPQVQVCRSRNTSGWFVAIYGYKGLILVMGVFMAWETRHIKVQALNDSQYIGICVYSAVFTAIITVLTSFISEYVVLSYLAKTLSILISTTLTLFLLFLPKLKSVFGGQQTQDPIMQSMGLKIECNTRRFINNDPKEQIFRLEIQNKVFKCELSALEREISRLENLLNFDARNPAHNIVYTICKKPEWTACSEANQNPGKSKYTFRKQINLCDFPTWKSKEKRNSNPEFSKLSIGTREKLKKAKSDLDILKIQI